MQPWEAAVESSLVMTPAMSSEILDMRRSCSFSLDLTGKGLGVFFRFLTGLLSCIQNSL